MICASCGNATAVEPCLPCGGAPRLGAYALVRALGHGTTGTTWLALDADGGEVAVKELAVHGEAKARELLVREVRVLRELNHPAIPRYLADFAWGTGRRRVHCVVQEYVAGRTLAEELVDRRFTVDDVLDVLERILEPLAYMHARSPPVVHRDLKPANVILRPDGRVALVDFGAVRDAWKGTLGGSTVAGTFGYMAPEQFHGDASPATDVYGAAALAVALLARKDPSALLDRQGGLNWRGFARVPPPIAALLEQMLAQDPALRPCDAASARSLLVTIRAKGWSELPRAPQAAPAAPPPLKGPVARVAERPAIEDPRFFPPTAPERSRAAVEAVVGVVSGGLGVAIGVFIGALAVQVWWLASERPPIEAVIPPPPPTVEPEFRPPAVDRPLVVLPGEGITTSSHALLWYEERITDPEVQRCLGSGSFRGELILAVDGRTGAFPEASTGASDCLRRALREIAPSLVPIDGASILFPVRMGRFEDLGGVSIAADSAPREGKLLLSGDHVFAHGEHADLLFQGASKPVSLPQGRYTTLVDGQMSAVSVAAGRVCTYHWDPIGGWYGGCL